MPRHVPGGTRAPERHDTGQCCVSYIHLIGQAWNVVWRIASFRIQGRVRTSCHGISPGLLFWGCYRVLVFVGLGSLSTVEFYRFSSSVVKVCTPYFMRVLKFMYVLNLGQLSKVMAICGLALACDNMEVALLYKIFHLAIAVLSSE